MSASFILKDIPKVSPTNGQSELSSGRVHDVKSVFFTGDVFFVC